MTVGIPSAVLPGVDGRPVFVEVHITNGPPGFTVVGLPDSAAAPVPLPDPHRPHLEQTALAPSPGHRQPGPFRIETWAGRSARTPRPRRRPSEMGASTGKSSPSLGSLRLLETVIDNESLRFAERADLLEWFIA